MNNTISISIVFVVLISFAHAYGAPGDVELTLDEIRVEPASPKNGELMKITAEIYNSGKVQTNSVASIITAAFFLDDHLIEVKDIGVIEPGIRNKVEVTSEQILEADTGEHVIKVIVDYHNTLRDEYDSPEDNALEKTFFIDSLNFTSIKLDTSQQYGIQGIKKILNITASLTDEEAHSPLTGKKIIFELEGEKIELRTNGEGRVSFPYINNFFNTVEISAHFEGDSQYRASDVRSILYALPTETTSGLILKIQDTEKKHSFEENPFEIIVFQNTYENIVKKVQPNPSTLLDSETLWIALPPDNEYFTEVYLNGTFFSTTGKEMIKENSFEVSEIKIPEKASVKFKLVNMEGELINEGKVKSQTYSAPVKKGFTDWVEIEPTVYVKTSHTVEIIIPEQNMTTTKSISVFPGERKMIVLNIDENAKFEIPEWVKRDAGWWAESSIDDETFVKGIEFMIESGVIRTSPSHVGSSLDPSSVPTWMKNNAGWWAESSIDDETFVKGIEFMIESGVITP